MQYTDNRMARIIAIMLGRLGMTVKDCLKAYRALGEKAFTPKLRVPLPGPPKGAYSSKALKAAIQQAITGNCREHRCVVTRRCHHADDIFQDMSCTKTCVSSPLSGRLESLLTDLVSSLRQPNWICLPGQPSSRLTTMDFKAARSGRWPSPRQQQLPSSNPPKLAATV